MIILYLWRIRSICILEVVPDGGLDLLEDLLSVVVEELVDGVGEQLVLAVEQVVHVDLHFPNLEVKVRVDYLQNLKSKGK